LSDNGEHTVRSAVYKSSHRKIGECAAANMDTTSSVKTKDSAATTTTADSQPQAVEQMTATMTRPIGVKRRRAVGGSRYIELAIVLDQLAVGIYGANAQTYVLTIINQVSALYKNCNFDYDMVFQVAHQVDRRQQRCWLYKRRHFSSLDCHVEPSVEHWRQPRRCRSDLRR